MTGKERVAAVFAGELPDRVPLFEAALNPHFVDALGAGDCYVASQALGLDLLTMWPMGPGVSFEEGDEAADEFGRVFRLDPTPRTYGRLYESGRLKSFDDLDVYTQPVNLDVALPAEACRDILARFPDRAMAFVDEGPLELTYGSFGMEPFFLALYENRELVCEVLRRRTERFITLACRAAELGMDYVLLADDSAFKGGSLMSQALFEELIIPHYQAIVDALPIPVCWHSDGFVEDLLPLIIKAGIRSVHSLEPAAGVDLGRVKRNVGDRLVLIGNVCCSTVLTQPDMRLVRADVDRCMQQAKAGGRYILSSCNSLHAGVDVPVGVEMFRYAAEVGRY
jgi:hypothetical protein